MKTLLNHLLSDFCPYCFSIGLIFSATVLTVNSFVVEIIDVLWPGRKRKNETK